MLTRRASLAWLVTLGFALAGALGPLSVAARAQPAPATLSATVGAVPAGQALPAGFVGVSFEYRAVHQYTGDDPLAIDPVLLALLRGLAPGQSPSIRIGGDSTDDTWWPIRGMIPQGGIYYPLTEGWLRTTHALAADLGAKLILGVNLAAGRTAIAAAEGRALVTGIGRPYVHALEIGNEPDLYSHAWYRDRNGHVYRARGGGYDMAAYVRQFRQWSRALPNVPLAGPAAAGPAWMRQVSKLIGSSRLRLITYHRYPLRACVTNPSAPGYASIPNLLADGSSSGLAAGVAPFAATAARHGLPLRVAEMNSASCEGEAGVSNTFASALWALDTMFDLARAGVQGVNFHMLPGSAYALFQTSQTSTGAWQANVAPEYYGLYMFGQAFPVGARLLPVSVAAGPTKVWATLATDGSIRVTVINQSAAAQTVDVGLAGATTAGTTETLSAPSLDATDGVTLGGQTFGDETATGTFPAAPAQTTLPPTGGVYAIPVAAGSATLLTIPGPAGGGSAPLLDR